MMVRNRLKIPTCLLTIYSLGLNISVKLSHKVFPLIYFPYSYYKQGNNEFTSVCFVITRNSRNLCILEYVLEWQIIKTFYAFYSIALKLRWKLFTNIVRFLEAFLCDVKIKAIKTCSQLVLIVKLVKQRTRSASEVFL